MATSQAIQWPFCLLLDLDLALFGERLPESRTGKSKEKKVILVTERERELFFDDDVQLPANRATVTDV